MTHINLIVNSLPRDLLEFVFFLAVGFTAGSVGIIYIIPTDPAVKPTARKKTNSSKSLGKEFTIKLI